MRRGEVETRCGPAVQVRKRGAKGNENFAGFTIFELFAVLSVVGVFGLFFAPFWRSSIQSQLNEARSAQCQENLRQIGQAVALYVSGNDGKFPGCQHEPPSWVVGLKGYGAVQERFVCAGELGESAPFPGKAPKWSYAINDFLTPHPYGARHLDFSRLSSIPAPAETMMFGEAAEEYRAYDHFHFADGAENGFRPEAFGEQVDAERHEGGANYLFVDGRVEHLDWSSGAKPKLRSSRSRFVHPAGDRSAEQIARR